MSTNSSLYDTLCTNFAEITSTDSALAMFFLQDVDWNLETALNNYYQSINQTTSKNDYLKVMSWNIQGLENRSIERRTLQICEIISKGSFDVVMLQEVVPSTLQTLKHIFEPDFSIHTSPIAQYFTALLLRQKTIKIRDIRVEDFTGSRMGRGLVMASVGFVGFGDEAIELLVINSHLESCREFSKERKIQLTKAFGLFDGTDSVIFGGDLNLRDKELKDVGGVPEGVIDVWEATGARKEAEYTWDTSRNHNTGSSYISRLRMDRMYLKSHVLMPVHFELTGLQIVPDTQLFSSDHWGIVAYFDT